MLLSPRGVRFNAVYEPVAVRICSSCYVRLERKKLPKNAIANGNYMGTLPVCLPHLNEFSRGEKSLLSPVVRFARVTVLEGGGQKQLTGHSMSYAVDVAKVATSLPLTVSDLKFRVIISSSYTTEQRARALRQYEVNRERVSAALRFLLTYNHLYGDIKLNVDTLQGLPVNGVPVGIVDEFDGGPSSARGGSSSASTDRKSVV